MYVKQGRRYRAAQRNEILEAAARFFVAEHAGQNVSAPSDAVHLARVICAARDHEVFAALWLDTRHRLLAAEAVFRGTIDGATIYPREVVKRALAVNASAVIVAHNHPSGVAEPSEADRTITLRLKQALALVEIRLLDHLVVTNTAHVSLAERDWL